MSERQTSVTAVVRKGTAAAASLVLAAALVPVAALEALATEGETTVVAVPSAETGLVYTGKKQTGVVEGTGYSLSGIASAKNAGKYTVTATLDDGYQWSDGTTEAKTVTWKIAKAANTMKVRKDDYSGICTRVAKKRVRFEPFEISGAKGTVMYKKVSGSKRLTINKKTGKVTIKKGTKIGAYKIKVKVRAAGTSNYKAKSVTKCVTIVVRPESVKITSVSLFTNSKGKGIDISWSQATGARWVEVRCYAIDEGKVDLDTSTYRFRASKGKARVYIYSDDYPDVLSEFVVEVYSIGRKGYKSEWANSWSIHNNE